MSRDNEDIERDLAEHDGMRPDEEAGPDASEASPTRCEFRQGERTAGPADSSFEMTDQLHDEFPVEPIPVVMKEDGLPDVVTGDPEDAAAIPFTYDTQLCIEDDREYVEMFEEDLRARGWKFINGWKWRTSSHSTVECEVRARYDDTGTEHEPSRHEPAEVEHLWGHDFVRVKERWVPVRPRRERCKFYLRQVFSNDSQKDPALPGHQIVFRLCGARRSNGGAYMTVSNEAVYACDFRQPFDVPSSRLQDKKDRKKLVDRPDLLRLPLFNFDGDAVQLENHSS